MTMLALPESDGQIIHKTLIKYLGLAKGDKIAVTKAAFTLQRGFDLSGLDQFQAFFKQDRYVQTADYIDLKDLKHGFKVNNIPALVRFHLISPDQLMNFGYLYAMIDENGLLDIINNKQETIWRPPHKKSDPTPQ